MALNTVTLTWDLKDFLQVGIPDSCVLFIAPNSVMADTTDGLIIPTLVRSTTFVGGTGSMSGIVANDNVALAPANTSYEIVVFDPAANANLVSAFNVQINHANGATQDLSTLWLNQAATPQPLVHYLQSSNDLADLASVPAAQTNLGLNSLAVGPASAIQQSFNTQMLSAGTTYSAAVNDLACANCTSGNTTITLPTAPADGSCVSVKLILQNTPSGSTGLYSVTVNTGGSDKFETSSGGTSANMFMLNEAATWRFHSATSAWVRQWGVLSMSQIQKNMPKVLNVLSYGADSTGATDSTAAFTAAIATATGSLAPSSHSRPATTAVYVPAGSYMITSDLLIQSTLGFNFFGDGPELTILVASGTGFTTGPIVVDGSYAGRYGGFTLKGDTTEQVTNAFTLTWTTGAARSTTGNKIYDIRVRNLNFVTGMNLAGVGNRQVDSTHLSCIVIGGSQTTGAWSNSGNWQQGFTFGNGTFANIYDQVLTRCEASNCYYGFYNNVSSFSLNGAQPANNFCDFYMNPGAQSTITNVQSQNSSQFVTSPSNFSPQPNTFNDCQFKTSYLSTASGNAFVTLAGGQWNFNNLSAGATQIPTTVASGSNGGTITAIASWSSPSAGVLDVAASTGYPASGTAFVTTSTGSATITYTGVSAGQLTGCAYVSGATGTVATGGAVSAYSQATISVVGAGVARPCTALFSNLTTFGTKVNAFSTVTNAIISVHGYNNYSPLTGNYTYATGDVASQSIGGVWTTVGGPGTPPQVNYITATGNTTYNIPVGAVTLDVTVVGGGAGGSSGAYSVASSAGGGAGGGAGGVSKNQFQASALTTPITVTVGAGGNGASAVTSAAAGNSGSVGTSTLFGSYLWAQGGRNGSGGSLTNSASAAGGAGGTGTCVSGTGGSTVSSTSATPTGATAQATGGGGPGGGIGLFTTVAAGSNGGTIANIATWSSPSAGVLDVALITNLPASGTVLVAASGATTAVVNYTGVATGQLTGCTYVSGSPSGTVATGGNVCTTTGQNGAGCTAPSLGTSSNSSAGGVVGGASPTNGSAPAAQGDTAPGGGGGAAATGAASSAQDGAAAQANSGGGGGGGGACQGGTTSGKGGNGGSGFALIIAYFQ